MKSQLFTYERDARREESINQSLCELLSSTDKWCALYTPRGEPKLKKVQRPPFGSMPEFEEILAYEGIRLVAVNHPEPWHRANKAIAEVYDYERGCTYYINNLEKTIRTVSGIHETIHTDKVGSRKFIFKGNVNDIIQEFRAHNYQFVE